MPNLIADGGDLDGPAFARRSELDLAALVGLIQRDWRIVAACVALAVGTAALYLLLAPSRYTATAELVIDPHKGQRLQNQAFVSDAQADSAQIESQVGILKSESVALAVIRRLGLAGRPGFVGRGEAGQGRSEAERAAVANFLRQLSVKRVGQTYVIQVAFTSPDREGAAEIANATAEAYVGGELEARSQATRRAGSWLDERLGELRDRAAAADTAVQRFRAAHAIVETGRGSIEEQQLADGNAQLAAARAATAEAGARLSRIAEIGRGGIPEATVADALRNDVVTRLRTQYLENAAKEAEWSERYGADHGAAANLRRQMRAIGRAIGDELRRIAETYRSDHEIALTRERSLEEGLGRLVERSSVASQARVGLRELESSAETARGLYRSFLQRSMEAAQQLSFPISDARIITDATPPPTPSRPPLLVLGGGLLSGLTLGVAGVLVRAGFDRTLRTAAEAESALGVPCLGILPSVSAPHRGWGEPAHPAARRLSRNPGLHRHVSGAPFSRFAETLRGVRVAIDLAGLIRETRVIGVSSAVPREGKSVLAANLAQLVAGQGARVLVIDADFRNPALSRALAPDASAGLADVLRGTVSAEEACWIDPGSGLRLLPSGAHARVANALELIAPQPMADLLDRLRRSYDLIVLDLPPVVPVVDAVALSHVIDGFVFAVAWGATSRDVVVEALAPNSAFRDRILGTVLTRADPTVLRRFERYRGRACQTYYAEGHAREAAMPSG